MNQRCAILMSKGWFIAVLTGCATFAIAMDTDIPVALRLPDTQILSLQAHAIGVQIYECKVRTGDSSGFEWSFKSPEADLYDGAGKKIGRHYAGPTWESEDGSKVIGEVKAQDNGPDPGAIPWLLLTAKSTFGDGIFSRSQNILRIHTTGGKAPGEGCSQAKVGSEIRVPYKADYLFYVDRP